MLLRMIKNASICTLFDPKMRVFCDENRNRIFSQKVDEVWKNGASRRPLKTYCRIFHLILFYSVPGFLRRSLSSIQTGLTILFHSVINFTWGLSRMSTKIVYINVWYVLATTGEIQSDAFCVQVVHIYCHYWSDTASFYSNYVSNQC
jgi:hypothetical protein